MRHLILLFLLAAPAQANYVHRITTSAQTSLDNAFSTSVRGGSTYSASGTNIQVSSANGSTFGGLNVQSGTAAAGHKLGTYAVHTEGSAWSFQESFILGDAVPSATTVSSGTVGSLPAWMTTTTSAAGHTAGTVTLTSEHLVTGSGGGAGSDVVLQTVSELSVLK